MNELEALRYFREQNPENYFSRRFMLVTQGYFAGGRFTFEPRYTGPRLR